MAGNGNDAGFEVIISSDSHVMEPSEIIVERAPQCIQRSSAAIPQARGRERAFRLIPAARIRRSELTKWRPMG